MRRIIFLLSILLVTIGVSAQQTVTVQAQSYQVSDNLDLEAVAITFGESKDVEDFERRLNDPENRISNLDLNNDGYVDFLRVVEVEEKGTHLIVIQAVIGQDLYQDVASVIVEGENQTSATVTIVGNRDIYGENYVIVPRYVVRPVIFDWLWLPTYAVYRSVWYWDYYPHYYHHYTCLGYHSYHRHIKVWHTHHHHHCDFHRPVDYHHNTHYVELHRTVTRNDYATHRPNQGYRSEPAPNRNLEARPATQNRQAGSLSTSANNRVERATEVRAQSAASTTTATISTSTSRRTNPTSNISTSTTRRTTTSANTAVSATRNTTTATPITSTKRTTGAATQATTSSNRISTTTSRSTAVRPTATTSRSTTSTVGTSTSASRSTTVRPATTSSNRTSVTTSRSTTIRPATTNTTSRSTTSTVRTNTSTSRSTAVRPTTSTSRSTSAATTTTAVKTNKNISTSRR